jgi:hypothetical protein
VLHHILDTQAALKEMARVVRPGGRIIVKESQVLPALFLPGYPDLEKRLQQAEIARSREEAGARSFQERRQRTPESLREAGLGAPTMHTYLAVRRAPLDDVAREYVQRVVFDRNWGARLRDYYCLYPISVFTARAPA